MLKTVILCLEFTLSFKKKTFWTKLERVSEKMKKVFVNHDKM